ncbi:hypothetical protein OAH73_02480 [Planktomarina sp.]|nr:hypothetical protein [Planktomarina sp.]MDB4841431.1 hypothetical protein [Planktomarina sp.]
MTKKPQTSKDAAEKVVKNIRRKTGRTYSAEEKIRIVLEISGERINSEFISNSLEIRV